MADLSDSLKMPRPEEGWSREIVVAPKALVVPPVNAGTFQQCGVYLRDGNWCGHAATWRGGKPTTLPQAERPAPVATLAGRHLWCGQIWAHFGHWICESMSRFWALDTLDEEPASLVFMVKRPDRNAAVFGFQKAFLNLLGIIAPVTILSQSTEIEELIIPGQGFGLGAIAAGTPEFRTFMRRRLMAGLRPDGARKIYISRSALNGEMGGIINEALIEKNLAQSGYETFHPQKHSLDEQIARYRAADVVLGPDGSAFHLFGFVATQEQKTGVILRRNSSVFRGITDQIAGFSGRQPDVIKALSGDWLPRGGLARASRHSFGEMNFNALRTQLSAREYIAPDASWTIPTPRQQKIAANSLAKARGIELRSPKEMRRERRQARIRGAAAVGPAKAVVADVGNGDDA